MLEILFDKIALLPWQGNFILEASVLTGGKSCLSKEPIKLNVETFPFWLNLKLLTEVIEMSVIGDIWRSLVQPPAQNRVITSYG